MEQEFDKQNKSQEPVPHQSNTEQSQSEMPEDDDEKIQKPMPQSEKKNPLPQLQIQEFYEQAFTRKTVDDDYYDSDVDDLDNDNDDDDGFSFDDEKGFNFEPQVQQNVFLEEEMLQQANEPSSFPTKARKKPLHKGKVQKQLPHSLKKLNKLSKLQGDNVTNRLNLSDDEQKVQSSNLPFSNKDLLKTKKKLKTVNHKKPRATMHRDALFDIHRRSSHYPLEKIKGLFVINEFTIDKLDFTGVQQLTDLFFREVQLVHSNSLFLQSVEHISLQGCQYITDVGVSWMCDAFSKLKSVSLNCCPSITERSLHTVMTKCPEVQAISAKATNVGFIPLPWADQLCGLKLFGCPLLSPPYNVIDNTSTIMSSHGYLKDLMKEPVFSTYKAVILKDGNVSLSFIQTLANSELMEQSHDKDAFMAEQIKLSDSWTLNMIECPMAFLDLVSSDMTLYVLPFDADNADTKAVLFQKMLHLKYKFPFAVFVLVGVSQKASSNLVQHRDLLQEQLKQCLNTLNDLLSNFNQDIYIRQKDVFFPEQIRAGHLFHLRDHIREVNEDLEKVHVFFVQETLCLKENKGLTALKEALVRAVQKVSDLHILYSRMSRDLTAMLTEVPRQPGIMKEADFVSKIRNKHRKIFGPRAAVYCKALELMHNLGSVIYIKDQYGGSGHVITDLNWISNIITKLIHCKQTAISLSDHILMVHPKTEVIAMGKVKDIMKDSVEMRQVSSLKKILKDVGLICEEENAAVFIMTSDLSLEPPVPISHYIDERAEVSTLQQSIVIPTGLVHSLWPVILSSVSSMHSPAMIWRAGVIIQDSPIIIYITVTNGSLNSGIFLDGHTEIQFTLQSAMSATYSACTEEKRLKEQWNKDIALVLGNTMKQYQIPIEHCLHKWNIFYKLTDMSGTNIVLPESEDDWSCLPVHDNFVTDSASSDIICNSCGMKTEILERLWCQYKLMVPSFILENSFSTSNLQNGSNKGSYFISNLHAGIIYPMRVMSVCGYNELRVTFLNEDGFGMMFVMPSIASNLDAVIGVDKLAEKQLFSVSVQEGKIKVLTRKQKTGNKSSPEDGSLENSSVGDHKQSDAEWIVETNTLEDLIFNVGDTLIAKIQHSNDKEEIHYSIELAGGDVLHEVVMPNNNKWIPVIQTNTVVSLFIDSFKAENRLFLNWREGLRLEAVDKQYPYLICVATVASLKPDDMVLIHFDGWTSKYDYWTSTTDPDLHPVGYMEYMISKKLLPQTIKQQLQAPQGYSGDFTWKKYLEEVKSYPVPHRLFTKEQAGDVPPFTFDEEFAKSEVGLNKYCYAEQRRPSYIQRMLMTNKEISHDIMKTMKDHPYVLLPRSLNGDILKYPSLKNMWLNNSDELHLICNLMTLHNTVSNVHIIEHEPANIPPEMKNSFQDVLLYQMLKQHTSGYIITLINQKNFLTGQMKLLVEGVEKWQHSWIEQRLMELFSLFLPVAGGLAVFTWYHLLFKEFLTPQKNVKQYASEVMQLLEKNKVLSQHLVVEGLPQCHLHKQATSLLAGKDLTSVPMEIFTDNHHLITDLNLENNHIKNLPEDFFISFVKLVQLNLTNNELFELPQGATSCKHLEVLLIGGNNLSGLSSDFHDFSETLIILDISRNPFHNLPSSIFKMVKLTQLHASDIILDHLDPEIQNLKRLTILDLGGNALCELPNEITELTNLEELDLSGVSYQPSSTAQGVLSLVSLKEWITQLPILSQHVQELEKLFHSIDVTGNGTLEHQDVVKFSSELYNMFPRLEQKQVNIPEMLDKFGCCPPQFFSSSDEESRFPQLRVLNLSCQGLRRVTGQFKQLKKLENLILTHNPHLESISGEISTLELLTSMSLRDCPLLKTPPREIVARGFKAVYGYLRRINLGSVECKRTKLMMVGLGGAGKTSLVRSLRRFYSTEEEDDFDHYLAQRYGTVTEGITNGIDISDWKINEVTFSMWDFAGQTVYYNTHQFFMSNRAVYLLLWNIRLGYEHAGLEFWLSSIACHAPKAPVLVVGTHRDQVEKYWLPKEELMEKYPQIRGFHEISCLNGMGIDSLATEIIFVTLKEKYMGERIPEAWLNFEHNMLRKKQQHDNLTWEQVESCAEECGIIDKPEVGEAVQFLHELGSVQHFQNHFLKSRVVINPQWIVDAMACVVSVHNTPIKDGKLLHSDIDKVWTDFDKDLHIWLLRLTEEFDLTFPLMDEKANIVPCLLPAKQPEIDWPDVSTQPGFKEIKMLYKFDYLPAGLFNRVQVRLYQFSDSSIMWKNGSLLRKNMHRALLKQEKNNVHIKVQGPRPENIKFMVHEVFEGLIAESFHGVTYDYFVPCPDCVKAMSQDPSLFPASKIRRATELKAPFLQCDKLFHTLSLHELHAVMPPDNSIDYDIHLERSLRDLDNLRDNLSYDIAFIYNSNDIPVVGEDLKKIHPRKIKIDLENNGYSVWFPADPSQIDLQKETITLREAKIVLICISNSFVNDPHSSRLFYYITKNLQKRYQLIALGSNYNWKQSDIGMLVTTDVFVNMMSPERYPHKIKELLDVIREQIYKLDQEDINKQRPQCFISYCWANSAEAVSKGTKSTKEAVGFGDPRAFKTYLEENGIRCWIDVDNVGKGSLFEEIAQGLKHAKVMVVCASDEYVTSNNCLVEFRFATVTLKIPLVIAVVGTGYAWESTEVGMLSIGHPKVNLQYNTPGCMQRLLEAVKKYIPESEDWSEDDKTNTLCTPSYTPSNNNQLAFLELLELAQRKFLRQLTLYADTMDTNAYPRLIALDFFRPGEKACYLEDQKKFADQPQTVIGDAKPDKTVCGQDRGGSGSSLSARGESCMYRELADQSRTGAAGSSSTEHNSDQASLTPRLTSSTGQRPGSAGRHKPVRLLKRKTTVNLDVPEEILQGSTTDYCIRFFCEHEEGWHDTVEILPMFPVATATLRMDDFFNDVAPYMARLYAILKHTSLDLPVLTTKRGENLRLSLIQKCGLESEFQKEYTNWCKSVMDNDPEGKMGGLARCHLPSGKVLWLCPEHQKAERITIMSKDAHVISAMDSTYADLTVAAGRNSEYLDGKPAEWLTNSARQNDGSTSETPTQSQLAKAPQQTRRQPSKLSTRGSARESSDSGSSVKNPEVQKAVANIISKGVTKQGSKACRIM